MPQAMQSKEKVCSNASTNAVSAHALKKIIIHTLTFDMYVLFLGEILHIYLIPFPPFLSLDVSPRLRQKPLHRLLSKRRGKSNRTAVPPYRAWFRVPTLPPPTTPPPYGTKVGNEIITFPEDITSAKSLTPFFLFCFFSNHPIHFFF